VGLLTAGQQELLAGARRAVLATVAPDGAPRLVPITFAVEGADSDVPLLYSALDEKPKSVADPRDLARVRDIVERPRVSVLVDHWSENWAQLAWLRLGGSADLLEPDTEPRAHARAVELLRDRYQQYLSQHLEDRPIVRIAIDSISAWSAQDG
jgi:PPOX class probable F420-dependent enzyme